MDFPPEYTLYTPRERPDIFHELETHFEHPINTAWPLFSTHDPTQVAFPLTTPFWLPGLQDFQFALVERRAAVVDAGGAERTVALAQALPFFWPELAAVGTVNEQVLQSLPEGGWDTLLARGIRQCHAREGRSVPDLPACSADQAADLATSARADAPNALSAIGITIAPDRRGRGLAERLLEVMKWQGRKAGLRALVVCARPTRKSEYPEVEMAEYVRWTQGPVGGSSNGGKAVAQGAHGTNATKEGTLPYDPWLRKHVRAGGRIIKIAPRAMCVEGSFADWQEWTGLDVPGIVHSMLPDSIKRELDTKNEYVNISIPGGLMQLRASVKEKQCSYIEPGIWLYHAL